MRCTRAGCVALGGLVSAACASDPTSQTACYMDERVGLIVEVRDALTDRPLSPGTVVIASTPEYREELQPGLEASSFYGLHERPGTYLVAVTHEDYRPMEFYGIVLRQGRCHVETRRITAHLTRVRGGTQSQSRMQLTRAFLMGSSLHQPPMASGGT